MEKKKNFVLIIVDMQNDFLTGSLANLDAVKTVPEICNFIKEWSGTILVTRDTHYPNYLQTAEGKQLPIEHCIRDTAGWCVNDDIQKALRNKDYDYVDKSSFGYDEWNIFNGVLKNANIYICGTCTDICVVSNALILKALYPNSSITVLANLCAGTTPEKHKAALSVMESCQIDVVHFDSADDPSDR